MTSVRKLSWENLFFPAGFDQPIAYETIERSMADDGGRGIGRAEEDMYACGVALAI